MKKNLLTLAATAFLSMLTFGQHKISFEAAEGYNLGTVIGQKEWTVKTDNVPNSSFQVVNGKASDGNRSVEVTSTNNYTENYTYLFKSIPEYDRISVSADVKLQDLQKSDYYMLSLYSKQNNDYWWSGGFNFMWSGKLYADSDVNFKDLGTWNAGQWYNLRIEIDHITTKDVRYYLDNQLVHTSPLSNRVIRTNDLNFEFDNDGSGFIVDNIVIKNMDQLSVLDTPKTFTKVFPNPASDYISVRSNETIKSVKLYSASGALVASQNKEFAHIDISKLPKGNYLISIETDSGVESRKIIKQ